MNSEPVFFHPQPWKLLEQRGVEWATLARQAGASTLQLWVDGVLVAHWSYHPATTLSWIETAGERWPQAQAVGLVGLELQSGEPYWLEGAGLEVCWKARIIRAGPPQVDQDPLLVGC